MRTTTAWVAGQEPRRSARDDATASPRRGELAAGLATVALIGQVLFAPVTLVIGALLVAVGRLSRWRPHWLLLPAVAGLTWLLEAGGARVASGFAASSRHLAGYMLAVAVHPAWLAHPGAAFAGATAWLPGQLPLALLPAAGEASIVLWLGWWRAWGRASVGAAEGWSGGAADVSADGAAAWPRFRPGLIALARRRVTAAALSAGRTVTADGCALGLQTSTGRLAGFSWAEASSGVLLAGVSRADLDQLGLAATCAALRLRKTVLLADLAGPGLAGPGLAGHGLAGHGLAGHVTATARSLGVAPSEISAVTVGESVKAARVVTVAGLAGRAIRLREVVVMSAGTADGSQQVIDGLTSVLADLRDLALRTDCFVWISGCDAVDAGCLAELMGLGTETGTAVLLSTTSAAHAARLAAVAGTIVATGPISRNLAGDLSAAAGRVCCDVASAAIRTSPLATSQQTTAADATGSRSHDHAITDILYTQPPGMFTILSGTRAATRPARLTAHCRAVPITSGDIR